MHERQRRGALNEAQAERMLVAQGLRLIERNYRCRGGEIDLIMRDGDHMVFVEVRYRANRDFGGALGSVDAAKQQRLVRAAQHYLLRSGWQGPCRFDVVGFDGTRQPQWVRDAFPA
jgi:putative endonuclease